MKSIRELEKKQREKDRLFWIYVTEKRIAEEFQQRINKIIDFKEQGLKDIRLLNQDKNTQRSIIDMLVSQIDSYKQALKEFKEVCNQSLTSSIPQRSQNTSKNKEGYTE